MLPAIFNSIVFLVYIFCCDPLSVSPKYGIVIVWKQGGICRDKNDGFIGESLYHTLKERYNCAFETKLIGEGRLVSGNQ